MSKEEDAKYLMQNTAWVEAVTRAKADLINAALKCGPTEDKQRFLYLEAAKSVEKISAHVGALIVDDKGSPVEVADYYAERAKSRFSALFSTN